MHEVQDAGGSVSTLFDLVREPWLFSQRKHGLGDTYAEDEINKLSNVELLREISYAVDKMMEEIK